MMRRSRRADIPQHRQLGRDGYPLEEQRQHRTAGEPGDAEVAPKDRGEPVEILHVGGTVEPEEATERGEHLRRRDRGLAEELFHDRARNQPDHREDEQAHSEEREDHGGETLEKVDTHRVAARLVSERHPAQAVEEARRVLLVYANRTAADIVFRSELDSIRSGGFPDLKTIHVLSQPPADWDGPTGRLDTEYLRFLCGRFSGKTFFICCPPVMASGLIRGLRGAGVGPERINADYFEL